MAVTQGLSWRRPSQHDIFAEHVNVPSVHGRFHMVKLGNEAMLEPVHHHLRHDDGQDRL